jgi:hypothetical protein
VSNVVAFTKQETTISAVLTKRDGTVINLGAVSYSHTSRLKTFAWYLRHPEQWAHKARKFAKWLWSFAT